MHPMQGHRALAALYFYGHRRRHRIMTNNQQSRLAAVAAEINNQGNGADTQPTQATEQPAPASTASSLPISAAECLRLAGIFGDMAAKFAGVTKGLKLSSELQTKLTAYAGFLREQEAADKARRKRAENYANRPALYQG